MKPTKYWSWSLKRLEGRGRYVMRGKYTEAQAFDHFHGQDPQRVDGSEEIRELPESPEEVMANQFSTGLSRWRREQADLKAANRSGAVQRPAP